jgi:hypothetical protein
MKKLIFLLFIAFSFPAQAWQKIIVVSGYAFTEDRQSVDSVAKGFSKVNDTIFKSAYEQFSFELNNYYSDAPQIEFIDIKGFYKGYISGAERYLNSIAARYKADLILWPELEYMVEAQTFNIQVNGYNLKENLEWPVLMSEIARVDLNNYLEEVYVQLMFEVLNEAEPLESIK